MNTLICQITMIYKIRGFKRNIFVAISLILDLIF